MESLAYTGLRSLSWRMGKDVELSGNNPYDLMGVTIDGIEYFCGNWDQVYEAAEREARNILEEGELSVETLSGYVDDEEFASDWSEGERDYFYEEVNSRPSDYIQDDPEDYSEEDEQRRKELESKIAELDEKMNESEDDEEIKELGEEQAEAQEELDGIEPTEYSEEQKDNAIESLVENLKTEIERHGAVEYLSHEFGYRGDDLRKAIERYFDDDQFVKDVVDNDGVASVLNHYDGNEYSMKDLNVFPTALPEEVVDFVGAENVAKGDIYFYRY